MYVADPAGQREPGGHTHVQFTPKVPAGHSVQVPAPAKLYWPLGHSTGAPQPAGQAYPALQVVQLTAPLWLQVPVGHWTKVPLVEPVGHVYPAVHAKHTPAVGDPVAL